MEANLKVRLASNKDIEAIHDLILPLAQEKKLLPRNREQIGRDLDKTWVGEKTGQIVATVCMIDFSPILWEVRALAVEQNFRSYGFGSKLLAEALLALREINLEKTPYRVFALTYVPEFFTKHGFRVTSKEKFPEKVYEVCQFCAKLDDCKEIAVEYIEK